MNRMFYANRDRGRIEVRVAISGIATWKVYLAVPTNVSKSTFLYSDLANTQWNM